MTKESIKLNMIKKINVTQAFFFEKPSVKLTDLQQDWQRTTTKKIHRFPWSWVKLDIIMDISYLKKLIKKNYKHLFTHTFDNLNRPLLWKTQLLQHTQYEIDKLNNLISIKEIDFIIWKLPKKYRDPYMISLFDR